MTRPGQATTRIPGRMDPYAHRGTRAIQRMVEFAPSTGGLALWVKHQDLPVADAPGLIATDGTTIYYSATFEQLPIELQTGFVAHEVLHIALRHPQRYLELRQLLGDVDLELYNVCADAIVNSTLSHLSWLQLPASAVLLEQLLLSTLGLSQGVEQALLEWDVERLYRAIDDRQSAAGTSSKSRHQRRGGGGDRRAGDAGRPDDSPSDSGKDARARADGPMSARIRALGAETPIDLFPQAEDATHPEIEAEQAREWSERILRAHAGDGAHSMLRTLIADRPRIRTPWEHVLRTLLARGLSLKPDLSWSRPSRSYLANQGRLGRRRLGGSGQGVRMPWEPGVSAAKAVPRLVVIVDVSGSIEDRLMERFAGEIEAITRRLESSLILVIGDRQVQRVAHFEPGRSDLRRIAFTGGGGTDFTPLLEEADRHGPDIGVVLTDLDGPTGFRPNWPVIWAVPECIDSPPQPFGRKLLLS